MRSKNKIFAYVLFVFCICIGCLVVVGYIIPRYNSIQQNIWYEKDIDLVVFDYHNTIHTQQCNPQITHYSYSYDKSKNNNATQYPFSSVAVTVCCDYEKCTVVINNEEGALRVISHTISNESSPPFVFVVFLYIIIATIIIGSILFSKWLKKKQIRLY